MTAIAWRLGPGQTRVLVLGLLLSSALFAGAAWASSRFMLAFDLQDVRCLVWWSYVIERGSAPERNQLVAFTTDQVLSQFPKGTVLVKRLVGVPGDRIDIADGTVRVNGELRALLSPDVMARLGRPPEAFDTRFTLDEGTYFVLGDAAVSFDSRYWGAIQQSQVVGQAWGFL